METSRNPTTLLFIFDATWADRNSGKRSTVVETIRNCVDTDFGNVVTWYRKGPGTADAFLDRYLGGRGGLGRGIKTNVIDAFRSLVDNYKDGDRIILIGASRGAYTARALAGLIDRISIPDERKITQKGQNINDVCRELYKKYTNGDLRKRGVADHLKIKYNSHPNVKISALCCFDTVGSLGIPYTGIFGGMRILRFFIKKREFLETDPASSAENLIHAISLHETRAPFTPTLMHVRNGDTRNLRQVYFPGTHSDLVWENEQGGVVDIPLAWMIEQLHTHAGLRFKRDVLRQRFPRMNQEPVSLEQATKHYWAYDEVSRSSTGIHMFVGKKRRIPGSYYKDSMETREQIHVSARLRGYGRTKGEPSVAGYRFERNPEGGFHWVQGNGRANTSGSDSSLEPYYIHEARLGTLEAELLGISP